MLGTAEVVSVRRRGVTVRMWRDVGSFEDCSLLLPGLETSFQPLSDTVRNERCVREVACHAHAYTQKLGTIFTCQNSKPYALWILTLLKAHEVPHTYYGSWSSRSCLSATGWRIDEDNVVWSDIEIVFPWSWAEDCHL